MIVNKIKLKGKKTINVEVDTMFVLDFEQLSPDRKYEIELIFEKEGVCAEVIGLTKVQKGQVVNLTTISNHKVSHTSCDVNVREVLFDNAESNYTGKIIIEKEAQQTNSFLTHNVLVIGDKTKNSSQPILNIDANDVSASHASTTGRIDETQLYYLTSRGLQEDEAKELIADGFFKVLSDKIDAMEVDNE